MLRVRMLSGEVTSIPLESVSNVREVKQRLHQHHGLPPRFRQRLILEGATLDDAEELDSPIDLDLVVQTFSSPSQAQADELVAAARDGSVQQVEAMLQLPLDPNLATEAATGERPLYAASRAGHVEVVRLLLEAGVCNDLRNMHGFTPLMFAVHGHVDVVRLLVEVGADKGAASNDGRTALTLAAAAGHTEVVRFLVEAGVNMDAPDNDGNTALLHSAAEGQAEVVRLLLEAGVDRDAANKDGNTALMLATLCGEGEVVRLLLEAGADKDAANNDGQTAQMIARGNLHHFTEIRRLLEKPTVL